MADQSGISTVQFLDLSSRPGPCGYCKGNEAVSQGMFIDKLTLEDYQDLLDQGWRRSGRCYLHPVCSLLNSIMVCLETEILLALISSLILAPTGARV